MSASSSVPLSQKFKLPNGVEYEQPLGLFINGEFVTGKEGKAFEVINPSTGKLAGMVHEATAVDVDLAVDAAETAFYDGPWSKMSSADRGHLLLKLADLFEENLTILASIEAFDNGKAIQLAKGDIGACIGCLRYYGGWADKIHGKVIETSPESFNYTKQEPIGVCGQIIPWNFPLLMWAWKIGPAIACGNTVVLKTAEQTPLGGLYAAKLCKEAGFPPGVINILSGFGRTAGAAIASHMKIHKVAFTGSTPVGRQIMKAAAESNLKKVTLELGGKSPNIVFEDADIDRAVEWINFGIYYNAGQCCCAGSRIYVQETIYDKVIDAFKRRAQANVVGNPFDEATFQGAQVSEAQYNRIMAYVELGKKEGATVEVGGERHGSEGYFIKPTVFSNVTEDMRIMQEEIFGPVCAIAKFKNLEDVIQKGNSTAYGLASAVHTRSLNTAVEVANRLRAGTVWVNCYNSLHWALPFGGYGESGIGRELGKEALRNYTQVKTVNINLS
ncbi:aldehyde dehydrogenase domain-containing protein [Lipomyces tetrasporus]|uniref:Aldehyde dehydrogenase 5, mitochondrial n=1 Tax=Lipomyces tetrasporus TaxID=54092 RepID=A0AAD7VQU6_9ASCO|nr:aldehyde dehydrogenase domain-containing protein [Lipomyces tetrasporus]KAJ8097525.1 aldehyde dehydrogenase domain-containing protein [Lipomyces tetrasporus]